MMRTARSCKQLAALICCAVAGYLSLATTCTDSFQTLGLTARTVFSIDETEHSLRFVGDAEGGISLVSISTDSDLTLRVAESELEDLSEEALAETRSHDGVLSVPCRALVSGCHDFVFVVERAAAGTEQEVALDLKATATDGACGEEFVGFIDVRVQEVE